MSTFQVIPSDENSKAIIRLYLENRKDMDREERRFFLDYLALICGSRFVMDTTTLTNEVDYGRT